MSNATNPSVAEEFSIMELEDRLEFSASCNVSCTNNGECTVQPTEPTEPVQVEAT
jgi:hypothetical protein